MVEDKRLPDIDEFAVKLAEYLGANVPSPVKRKKLERVIRFREHVTEANREALVRSKKSKRAS